MGNTQCQNTFQSNFYPEEVTVVMNEVPVARPKHVCQKHSDCSIILMKACRVCFMHTRETVSENVIIQIF